jgi:long-chain fatty acid transport protein
MNLHRTAIAAAFAAALLLPCAAFGAGYGIFEQGASALGMAGAGTASVHDASAVFFNPGAIARLDGHQLYFGDTWLSTSTSFAGVDPYPGFGKTEEMNGGNFFPPTVYFTNKLNSHWAYGAGVNAPFGLGVDWKDPHAFTGRARVTKADVRTINGNLSLSYAPNNAWSFGVGYDALFAGVELHSVKRQVTPGGAYPNVADVTLKSSYKPGYTWNAGALWTPLPDWKFALNYRAQSHVKVDNGEATFKQILTGDPVIDGLVAANLPGPQKVTSELRFPSILSVGAAWNPVPEWTWEVDANKTSWSWFKNLELVFPNNRGLDQVIVEDYKDSWRVNIGAEHRLPNFTYRFGYYFDQAAAPSESVTPLLPDANRHGATIGLGFKLGQKKAWTLDLYNLALFVENRSTEGQNRDGYNGTYKSYVNAAGVNLGYHW